MEMINKEFSIDETLRLLTKAIHTEIKYYEEKMLKKCKKHEVRMYKLKIKKLQKELYEVRFSLEKQGGKIKSPVYINLNTEKLKTLNVP